MTRLPTTDAFTLVERAMSYTFRLDGLVRSIAGPYANTTTIPPGIFISV